MLSKPINRRQFIVGKFLGIELGVLALYVLLGALFAAGVWYKYAYDLRESAGGPAESAKQWAQVMQVMPGLALGFFEVTILTSISVAISTRLPMLANLVVCILIFFLGHLSPVLVELADAGPASTSWWVSWPSFLRGSFPRSSSSTPAHRSQPVRSFPGLATFCRYSAIACCTVEQRCYLRFCCSRTATWPDPTGPREVLAHVRFMRPGLAWRQRSGDSSIDRADVVKNSRSVSYLDSHSD